MLNGVVTGRLKQGAFSNQWGAVMQNVMKTVWIFISVLITASLFFLNNAYGTCVSGLLPPSEIKQATHVVLATEGDAVDGVLDVVECWKGDLKPGDVLEIPELAQFATPESRKIERGANYSKQKIVTGKRMILFLIKAQVWGDSKKDKVKTKWLPVNTFDTLHVPAGVYDLPQALLDMRISVAWIEDGTICAFFAETEYRKQVLSASLITPEFIKKKTDDWVTMQYTLRDISAIPDPAERVKKAIQFAKMNPNEFPVDAIEIVAGSGELALPSLQQMYEDPSFEMIRPQLIGDIGDVAGASAGAVLTGYIEKELAYWREIAPGLEVGWRKMGRHSDDLKRLLGRELALYEGVQKVGALRYPGCKASVMALRDFWISFPQLNDDKGVCERCDYVINELGRPPGKQYKHAWGYKLALTEPDPVRRAQILISFLDVGDPIDHVAVLYFLSKCGVPALESLRGVINNTKDHEERNLLQQYYNMAYAVSTRELPPRKTFSFDADIFGRRIPIGLTGTVLLVLVILEGILIYSRRAQSNISKA